MNVTVNHKKKPVSLIPYLKPEICGISIDLAPGRKEDAVDISVDSMFGVISAANPFSKIIYAHIHQAGNKTAEPVLLLTQKDHYGSAVDMTLPDNRAPDNLSLDRDWQAAFNYYSKNHLIRPPLIINDQVSENGDLIPFQPLCYCRHKQSYFPPLCPICGAPLEECHDDDLLTISGLQPFSASAERYLCCSCCIVSAEADSASDRKTVFFYAPGSFKDKPENVKGPDELISGFGNLTDKDVPDNRLPCISCDCHQQCYGKSRMADSRLTVFSFFPFYMIMFQAPGIHWPELVSAMPEIPVPEKGPNSQVNAAESGAAPESAGRQDPPPDIYAAKKEINRILGNIFQKWQHGSPAPDPKNVSGKAVFSDAAGIAGAAESGVAPSGGGDLERTVIISSRNDLFAKISAAAQKLEPEKTVIIRKKDAETSKKTAADHMADFRMEKTVIITADSVEHLSSPADRPERAANLSGDETLILQPKASAANHEKEKTSSNRGNIKDPEKTVIITPGKSAISGLSSPSGQTIIFGDDPAGGTYPNQQPESDDSLEKTVIIQPKQPLFNNKDGKDDKKDYR